MSEKVLLHACCAVCFSHPNILLTQMGYEVLPFFYNPNIYPMEEYGRRLNELIKIQPKTVVEKDDENFFYDFIKGFENEPEKGKRCLKCFELRLDKTAQYAQKNGIQKFTTTLTVSPHKISSDIFEIGEKIAQKYELEFLKIDFKKQDGFKKTQILANELNLYKQTYCGCKFSIKSH